MLLARHLGKSAIARLDTASSTNGAPKFRGVVRPNDDLATPALCVCIGCYQSSGLDCREGRIWHFRVPALEISANESCAATNVSGNVDMRSGQEHNPIAENFYCPARRAGLNSSRLK